MSAGALSSQSTDTQLVAGLRRINLRTDLRQVADLLEISFGATLDASGRAMLRELRMLSRSGPFFWLIAGVDKVLQSTMSGYVWIDGETQNVIGNVSLYPTHIDNIWAIANVAVHPNFRRQGIALQLMKAAVADAHRRQAKQVVLQVDANDTGAQHLYEKVGFTVLRTFTRWRRRPYEPAPPELQEMPRISFRRRGEWKQQLAVAQAVRPNEQGGIGWLRPTRKAEFKAPLWKMLLKPITLGSVYHWVVRHEANDALRATAKVEAPIGRPYVRIDLFVDPHDQGYLERPLMNYLVRFWTDRRKGIVIEHPADDLNARAVFRDYDFEVGHHMMTMAWKP